MKTTDTATKEIKTTTGTTAKAKPSAKPAAKNIVPSDGYYIHTLPDGGKQILYAYKDRELGINDLFIGTYEEACTTAGLPFTTNAVCNSEESAATIFTMSTLSEFSKREKRVKSSIGKIDKSFESIAFDLYWIYSKQAYRSCGYATITDYSDDKFGYAKTTCYSLIGVVDRFAKRDQNGLLLEEFDSRIKGYSVSKLSLMVGLTDEQIASLKPEMSVRAIKKFVKSLEGKAIPDLSDGNADDEEGDGDAPSGDDGNIIDMPSTEISRQLIISCKSQDDYSTKAPKIDELIARIYRAMPDITIEITAVRNKPFAADWSDTAKEAPQPDDKPVEKE